MYQLICITLLHPVNDNYSINLFVALCMVTFVQSFPKIAITMGALWRIEKIYVWSGQSEGSATQDYDRRDSESPCNSS